MWAVVPLYVYYSGMRIKFQVGKGYFFIDQKMNWKTYHTYLEWCEKELLNGENRRRAWTFWIFLCRTAIFDYADGPESVMDKKTAAGLQRGTGKQVFGGVGAGRGSVGYLLRSYFFLISIYRGGQIGRGGLWRHLS